MMGCSVLIALIAIMEVARVGAINFQILPGQLPFARDCPFSDLDQFQCPLSMVPPCPPCPSCPLPLVEKTVAQQVDKVIKHVPVVQRFMRPVIETRTRHIPMIRKRLRAVIEPYTCHVPVIEKYARPVEETIIRQVPVVTKRCHPVVHEQVNWPPRRLIFSMPKPSCDLPFSPMCPLPRPCPTCINLPNIGPVLVKRPCTKCPSLPCASGLPFQLCPLSLLPSPPCID